MTTADRVVRTAAALAAVGLCIGAGRVASQQPDAPEHAAHVPFGVGEKLTYDVRFGHVHVGGGDMEVLPMDTVRGHDTWHTIFRLDGGIPFYHVHDRYESWLDVNSLASLRYWQSIDEGSYDPKRHYEIYPDRKQYVENTKPAATSVEHPLDDGSFVYFLRTIDLRVGLDTTFNDYFQADRNPVRIRVVRRDTITVPAGTFAALVIQPVINAKGIFSQGGDAQIWLSDDARHIMLQMKSKLSFGSLNLYLKSYAPATEAAAHPAQATPPR